MTKALADECIAFHNKAVKARSLQSRKVPEMAEDEFVTAVDVITECFKGDDWW